MVTTMLPLSEIKEEEEPLSIKDVAYRIKYCVENNFTSIKIQGEISGYRPHSSGHHYFALKDEEAVLDAICWRGTKLEVSIQDGHEVVVMGRVTTYPMRSKYQIIVEQMLPKGQGALQALLKERMVQYQTKGYFNQKRPLPRFPKIIGVVTSETGAVFRDILHRIADRYPMPVILWPVLVQGVGAKEQIAQAINGFNQITNNKPDILIVGRGGGSLEDLWAFNEPEVLDAAFKSAIPIISAVGHETDTTLLDYVADKRAPTPTAAAEMAIPARLDILQDLNQWHSRLFMSITHCLKNKLTCVQMTTPTSPQKIVENWTLRLDDLSTRHERAIGKFLENKTLILFRFSFESLCLQIRHILERKKQGLLMMISLLEQSSLEKTLQRGFCIPLLTDGTVATFNQLNPSDAVNIKFYEGVKKAVISN